MSTDIVAGINPFKPVVTASKETIRKFVKEMDEISASVKDAQADLKEALASHEEIIALDDQIKQLKEERKEVIANSAVLQGYLEKLNEVLEERKQIVDDAKQDGVPKKEIDAAIKFLKTDTNPQVVTQVYTDIADLV